MDNTTPFSELIDRCRELDNKMHTAYKAPSPTIEFSNSGKGKGTAKYFQIALPSVLQTLVDIKNSLSHFQGNERYIEKKWRDLFHTYLTDPAANAQSTVQTLPLFSVLSKIIHITNEIRTPHSEHVISLQDEHLSKTIEYIDSKILDEELLENPPTLKLDSKPNINEHDKPDYDVTHLLPQAGIGENTIYYGAPGTGKSYSIDNATDQRSTIRTVFHSDTQNNDFIGSLKPSIDEAGELTYAFQPGPFTDAYVTAVNNPSQHYWLVIEEINRAAASTAFGEIFQLLDRESDGTGSYQINASDPLWATYLRSQITNWNGVLRMPSNLSLLATMNSSDQAVMPMDTAFKRRWKFNYIPLDFDKACANGYLALSSNESPIHWKEYAEAVNLVLSENQIPEDRHLGPFFLNDHDLSEPDSALTGKLFMYLWDDILRHGLRHIIFSESIKTYGQLISSYQNGKNIYSLNFLSLFDVNSNETASTPDL